MPIEDGKFCLKASVVNRGAWGRSPAAPCPAICGWPVTLAKSACGRIQNLIVPDIILLLIHHISTTGNVVNAHLVWLLVCMPFVALGLILILMTSGARSPGVDATPRRYRLLTEVTRWGRAWLAWKAYLCRGLLHSTCMKIDNTWKSW